MSVTINSLSKATNNPLLKQVTRELITSIMGSIVDANENGKCMIEYDLPVSFIASGISKADAQLIVWTDVISALSLPVTEGGRGFKNVKLVRSGAERFTLIVAWDSGLTEDERTRRMDILRSAYAVENKPDALRHSENEASAPSRRHENGQQQPLARTQTPVTQSPVRHGNHPQQYLSPLSQWRYSGHS